ncbi:MAG: putative 2OG-Fe(II) oxygenase [Erythrobacter sp.]|nr:putative 2OG-Fe(II) oxygenase [Erythrobacter sp.]
MTNPANLTTEQVLTKAIALRDSDDPQAARSLLEKAIEHRCDDPRLWQMLGLVHRAMDDSAGAIDALARAHALARSDVRIAHALARVTLEAGLPASELFRQTLSMAPADMTIVLGLSAALFAEGDGEAAIATLASYCERSPSWIEGIAALADLRWLMRDENGFASSYTRALGQRPYDQALWMALINHYIRIERYDWASKGVEVARKVLGDTPALQGVAAICASELGDWGLADSFFAAQPDTNEPVSMASRRIRHMLRRNRPDLADALAAPWLDHVDADHIWPYAATAWRMMGDPRAEWLFGDPALVTVHQIYQPGELEALAATLRQIHSRSGPPAGQSVRHGTQTDGPLFSRIEPEIVKLRERIRKATRRHLAGLTFDGQHPILRHRRRKVRFAGSWSVRLTDAGHHSNHVHPQGWFSSAFYVAVPCEDQAGPAPAGHLQLGVPPTELGIALEPTQVLAPQPGSLALFPSILWHGTCPIAGGERMTVAYDIAPPR